MNPGCAAATISSASEPAMFMSKQSVIRGHPDCFKQGSIDMHRHELAKGGVIIYDGENCRVWRATT